MHKSLKCHLCNWRRPKSKNSRRCMLICLFCFERHHLFPVIWMPGSTINSLSDATPIGAYVKSIHLQPKNDADRTVICRNEQKSSACGCYYRQSAVSKLSSAPVTETVRTHQLTSKTDVGCGLSTSTLCAGRAISKACSSGVSLMTLSTWQRLLDSLQSFVGLQSATHKSYSLIN